MTDQPIQRYGMDWGMEEPFEWNEGPWVSYSDHVAALARQSQPAELEAVLDDWAKSIHDIDNATAKAIRAGHVVRVTPIELRDLIQRSRQSLTGDTGNEHPEIRRERMFAEQDRAAQVGDADWSPIVPGEHVDWCRDLNCAGCVSLDEDTPPTDRSFTNEE